jgi:hypothetical protein
MRNPEQLRRRHAAMTGNDSVIGIDQDRIRPAEGPDRLGNYPDLLFWVRAGIGGIGLERADRDLLDD